MATLIRVEETNQPDRPVLHLSDRRSFVWLVLAFLILIFANGLQIVAIAAWLGPLFMLRFVRTQRLAVALLVGYLVNTVAFYIQWQAAFRDAGTMFAVYTAAFALLQFLPYAVDRVVGAARWGFAGTLVFPASWVTMEYVLHLVNPLGTFFNLAYTQSGNLPLLQVMAVTGLWGVSFLVTWFASVLNYTWEGRFAVGRVGAGALTYLVILGAVLFFGGMRLALAGPTGPTIQVAVLTTNVSREYWPDGEDTPLDQHLVAGTLTPAERQQMSETMAAIDDDLLARTRAVARRGAKIVTWSEYNAGAFAPDEAAFLERARAVAREEKVFLAFPLIVLQLDPARRPTPAQLVTNKSLMITPEGTIAYQYVKRNLLIGWETDRAVRGPATIDAIDTPYRRLASVICLDMEYPDFMRLAGQQGMDLVLSGAIDGTAATNGNPLHSQMASFRAIEEGFSLARAGLYGQSAAVDYQGRVWGASNYFTASDRSVVAFLPVKGARTLYATLGDYFPRLCAAVLFGFVLLALARARPRRSAAPETLRERDSRSAA